MPMRRLHGLRAKVVFYLLVALVFAELCTPVTLAFSVSELESSALDAADPRWTRFTVDRHGVHTE